MHIFQNVKLFLKYLYKLNEHNHNCHWNQILNYSCDHKKTQYYIMQCYSIVLQPTLFCTDSLYISAIWRKHNDHDSVFRDTFKKNKHWYEFNWSKFSILTVSLCEPPLHHQRPLLQRGSTSWDGWWKSSGEWKHCDINYKHRMQIIKNLETLQWYNLKCISHPKP